MKSITFQKRYFCFCSVMLVLIVLLSAGCFDQSSEYYVTIQGQGVESEESISLSELKAMEKGMVEDDYFSVNTYGTEKYTSFKGIWIWHLLSEKVSLDENAERVVIIAEDGYQTEFSLAEVKRDDYIDQQDPDKKLKMILAFEQDGEQYDPEDGNPFRLIRGQKEPGDVNEPYWVSNVETIEIQ